MAARGRTKKKTRRKSPKTFSLWNITVGYIYLDAFTRMATGLGPWAFVTGDTNLVPTGANSIDSLLVGGR